MIGLRKGWKSSICEGRPKQIYLKVTKQNGHQEKLSRQEYTNFVREFVALLDQQLVIWEESAKDSRELHELARRMPALISLINTVGYLRGQDNVFLDVRPRTENQKEFNDYTNMSNTDSVMNQILAEESQGHRTRKFLYKKIEKELGTPVILYFTSFVYPVSMYHGDCVAFARVLQGMDLSKGLTLMLESLGGDSGTAERIINLCRSYSGTGTYNVIVPRKARSSATEVCLGAEKIFMRRESELGPLDLQIRKKNSQGKVTWLSLANIVASFESTFEKAVQTKGNVKPYLQQLANFDIREIEKYKIEIESSNDAVIKSLKSGMMRNLSENEIKKRVRVFTNPPKTKVHYSPIYFEQAKACGLNVEMLDVKSRLWDYINQLYVRMERHVNSRVAKCVESYKDSYVSGPPKKSK